MNGGRCVRSTLSDTGDGTFAVDSGCVKVDICLYCILYITYINKEKSEL